MTVEQSFKSARWTFFFPLDIFRIQNLIPNPTVIQSGGKIKSFSPRTTRNTSGCTISNEKLIQEKYMWMWNSRNSDQRKQ